MPRTYKPKDGSAKRVRVDESSLQKAVAAVLKGHPIKTTAKQHNVPVMTLKRYARKQKASEKMIQYGPDYGLSSRAFTDVEEEMLEGYILKASKLNHGLTPLDVRKLAYQFAIANDKPIVKKWVHDLASYEWYYGFMRRRKGLSLRKPQATSLSRATSFNKHNVRKFFDNLRSIQARYNFAPRNVWNLDETGVNTVHNPTMIVAGKGCKQVSKATSGERGENVTACCAVNAAGGFIPPFMIFPRKNWQDRMLNNCFPGTIGVAHPSGWMTGGNFPKFLVHLKEHTKCSPDDPCLVIMDNHDSHITIESLTYAKANGIHLLTIPPHTSHKLQPLDRTVFGPCKSNYNRACDNWMSQHGGKTMTIYEVAECFNKGFTAAFTVSNIISGFRTTGICPFNPDVFTESDYLSSYVTDRPDPAGDPCSAAADPGPSTAAVPDLLTTTVTGPSSDAEPTSSTATDFPTSILEAYEPPIPTDSLKHDSNAQTSAANIMDNQEKPSRKRRRPARFLSEEETEEQELSDDQPLGQKKIKTPEEIKPFPKASPRKNSRRGRKRGETQILTDTPVRTRIVAEFKIKQEKQEKQQNEKQPGKRTARRKL